MADGAPTLPSPTGPLAVAVTIAAPEDQTRLDYERESFRLQGALTALGQSVAFSDLGAVDDFVEVVAGQRASAVHFSGHGLPGELVFEDDYGLSERIAIDELLRRLRLVLAEPETFPRLFFLASCHGATGSRVPVQSAVEETAASAPAGGTRQPKEDLAAALDQGPSTAATLHRSGFVQVIGYFGPELRQDLSGLVLYVDNAETLQDGPTTDDPKALGNWKPVALEWWNEMKRLAEDGLVLVSTRYGWKGLHPRSSIPVDPMSPADVLRMLDTFESFEPLSRWDRERLARRADGGRLENNSHWPWSSMPR